MIASRFSSESVAAWILAAIMISFPPLAIIAPLAIAGEGVVLGLAVIPFVVRMRAWRRVPVAALALPAILALWGLASAPWAVDPLQAVKASIRLLAIIALGGAGIAAALQLPKSRFRPARIALVAGVAFVAAMCLLDILAGHPLAELVTGSTGLAAIPFTKRGVTVLALLIWPVRSLLRGHVSDRMLAVLTTAAIAVIFLGDSSSAKLAAGLGIVAVLAAAAAPRRGPMVLAAALVTATLVMPVAVSLLPSPRHTFQNWTFLSNSAHHRMTIWSFTGERIAEKPLLGWGMNSSRSIPHSDDEIVVRRYDAEGNMVMELTEAMLPLHPHNVVLQVWLELGLPGVLAFSALLVWIFLRIAKAPIAVRGDLSALTAAAFAVSTISYGFWQGWWQASLWLIAVTAAMVQRLDTPVGSGGARE